LEESFVCIEEKSLLLVLLIALSLVNTSKVSVTSASPATQLLVDPPEVSGVMPPNEFLITMNVTEAPETFSWEISLSWDPELLNLTYIKEGDFLHRWVWDEFEEAWVPKYSTSFLYPPLNETNLNGKTIVSCSLKGALPTSEWASGNGWLCSLGFKVKAQSSCILDLFDTRLWDHMSEGYPAYTYYPSIDGFFYNVDIHDIAVTNIVLSATQANAGDNVAMNVTVRNKGIFDETFNCSLYADLDTSVVADEINIGMQTGITIGKGASTTVPFTWDTKGVAGGNYTISAKAIAAVDDNPDDNLFTGGTVKIEGTSTTTDILSYLPYIAAAVAAAVVVVAVAVYFMKFRKKE